MEIRPLHNTNFTGIFRRKQKNDAVKTGSIAVSTPKEETPTIKLGEFSFVEGLDKRKFFANYPRHLQESYIITNNGFTTYEVTKKRENGEKLEHAQFAFDNVVVTTSKDGHRESIYFKSGRKDKSIIFDFNGNTKQKTIYSDNDENIISEIDDYQKGMLSRVTTFYPQHQKEVLFVAGHGIAKTSYNPKNKRPKEVIDFDISGSVIRETSYNPNGDIKEKVEYGKDGSKTVTSFTNKGTVGQKIQYDPQDKITEISVFNELGNTTTLILFNKDEKPISKFINDDLGKPIKVIEYDYEKKCLTTTTYDAEGSVESVEAEEIENPDFEEI